MPRAAALCSVHAHIHARVYHNPSLGPQAGDGLREPSGTIGTGTRIREAAKSQRQRQRALPYSAQQTKLQSVLFSRTDNVAAHMRRGSHARQRVSTNQNQKGGHNRKITILRAYSIYCAIYTHQVLHYKRSTIKKRTHRQTEATKQKQVEK